MYFNNNIAIKKGSSILIAPFSSIAESLKKHLEENFDVTIIGFLDRDAKAENIFPTKEVNKLNFDNILIISPNHAAVIYNSLLGYGVSRNNIKLVSFDYYFKFKTILSLRIGNFFESIFPSVQKLLQSRYKHWFEDENHFLLLSPDFVDINIKDIYLYIRKQKNKSVVIATNNKQQLSLLNKKGFDVVEYPSLKFIYHSLKAKTKITDHSLFEKSLVYSLINSKTVQIWHGIPIKKIGHMADYKAINYDLMVSTSKLVTEYSFSKAFSYKNIINAGYPRNDVLMSHNVDEMSLSLVNEDIYVFLRKNTCKLIVYMPTWREGSFKNNPINLEDLNIFAKRNDIFILIKMHPFIRCNTFFDTLEQGGYVYSKNYKDNVLFYPSTDDIYSILSFSDLLITDYSSIYFDYLLVNKPIIFFMYDKDEYIAKQGEFMLDVEEFTPGIILSGYKDLKDNILLSLNDDKYERKRKELRRILFDEVSLGRSSEIIFESISGILECHE